MRGHRAAWRTAAALLTALGLVASLTSCGPAKPDTASARASPRPTAATPTPPPEPTAAPTTQPTSSEELQVHLSGASRAAASAAPPTPHDAWDEEVEREPFQTPCQPGLGRWLWQMTDFAEWTRDGATIVFSRRTHVYAVAADGASLRQIVEPAVSNVGTIAAFTIAPDSAQVIYATCDYPDPQIAAEREVEWEDYQYELVRMRVDGTKRERLTTNSRIDNHPAWSPDGRRIAFLTGGFLSSLDAEFLDGTGHVLYSSIRFREYPWGAHFPGGVPMHYLAFRLYTMAPDGSHVQRLPTDPGWLLPVPPQWSPDSERLAIVKFREGALRLYTVEADGGGLRRLTDTVSVPSWSPDGKRIAFAKPDGGEVALYTIAADGTDAQRVITIPYAPEYTQDEDPDPRRDWIPTVAWSPSGEHILYSCYQVVCVVALDGTLVGTAPLALRPHVGSSPVATWSPDGSRIAVSTGVLNRGIVAYTMAPDGSDMRVLVVHDEDAGMQAVGPRPLVGPVDVAGCAGGTAVPEPAANPGLVQDCETLLVVQAKLAGVGGLGWTTDQPLTDWEGVVLGDWPLRVRRLTLAGRGLRSVIPPELARLTQLSRLDLSGNHLGGAIPPALGSLTELRVLVLQHNYVGGAIPAELGQLAKLEELYLGGTQVTGCIPAALQRVPKDDLDSLGLPVCEPG